MKQSLILIVVVLAGLALQLAVDEVNGKPASASHVLPNESAVTSLAFQSPLPLQSPLPTPTPIKVSSQECKARLNKIPVGQIMAVSSECQISDFTAQAKRLSGKYGNPNDPNRVMPPVNPQPQSGPEPLRVIGTDDRIEVNDTTVFPWTAVVKIEGQWNSTDFFACTGWMLGPSTVVSAGHCIYNFLGTKTFAYNVTVTPALNTDSANSRPFGACSIFTKWVLTPWLNNGDPGYDYGVYDLTCTIGYQTGNFGINVIAGSGDGTFAALPGYPGDKGGTTMWTAGGTIQQSQPLLFFYDIDMTSGRVAHLFTLLPRRAIRV